VNTVIGTSVDQIIVSALRKGNVGRAAGGQTISKQLLGFGATHTSRGELANGDIGDHDILVIMCGRLPRAGARKRHRPTILLGLGALSIGIGTRSIRILVLIFIERGVIGDIRMLATLNHVRPKRRPLPFSSM